MEFNPDYEGRVVVSLWNGSVVRGQMARAAIEFQVIPGPTLTVPISRCRTLRRAQAASPREVRQQVNSLLARLAGGDDMDRKQAAESLQALGPGILLLLEDRLQTLTDSRARVDLADIIHRLGKPSH
jgi:hypothetical protein